MRVLIRFLIAAALGLGAAALVSCGSSGGGLIPLASAGPLRSDFERVVRAAQAGNGDCKATTQALERTERDFHSLPTSIDTGLHSRLSEGIKNLRSQALALCEQPLANTSTATTATTTKSIQTTPTNTTQTTPTTTTNTQSTPTDTTGTQTSTQLPPGGGTQAPSESPSEGTEAGKESHESGQIPGSSGGTGQGNH
jgi:hypothetical protein